MTRAPSLFLAAALVPAITTAQDRPIVEIGTNLGVTITSSGGNSLTQFGVPGQGILGQPTIYATFFAGRALFVEPQIALNVISSGGQTATTVGLAGQVGYLPNGPEVNSFFVAGLLAFQSVSGGGFSDSETAAGAKLGYRILIGTSVGVRVEGGYRRWFDSELNEFSFGIGIGGVVHSSP